MTISVNWQSFMTNGFILYSKTYFISCANIYHDVLTLKVDGIVKTGSDLQVFWKSEN